MGDLAEHVKVNVLCWPKHVVKMLERGGPDKDDYLGKKFLERCNEVEFISE